MRVAITGIGLMTPLGRSREKSWQQLLSQKNRTTQSPETSYQQTSGAICVPNSWIPECKKHGRLNAIALQVACEAIEDAGWLGSEKLRDPRFACVIGTSKGPLEEYHSPDAPLPAEKTQLPFLSILPSGPLSHVQKHFRMEGPSLCPVSACATGLDAVLRGVRLIEQGDCDFVLAGSVDASANQYVLNSYKKLGILATNKNDQTPEQSCKPFDVHRNGFVIGEGAAMFVLMRDDSPLFRPEKCYAHWQAGLSYNDPAGLTQLDLKGETLHRLLGDLLLQAKRLPSKIDLLHLHGTGTESNDLIEAQAVCSLFGNTARQPWSTASKGIHGHALGAAGSIELAWLLLSLRDQVIPNITNLKELDSRCPIRPVLDTPLRTEIDSALKLSLGFGGHQIGCIVSRGSREARLY